MVRDLCRHARILKYKMSYNESFVILTSPTATFLRKMVIHRYQKPERGDFVFAPKGLENSLGTSPKIGENIELAKSEHLSDYAVYRIVPDMPRMRVFIVPAALQTQLAHRCP